MRMAPSLALGLLQSQRQLQVRRREIPELDEQIPESRRDVPRAQALPDLDVRHHPEIAQEPDERPGRGELRVDTLRVRDLLRREIPGLDQQLRHGQADLGVVGERLPGPEHHRFSVDVWRCGYKSFGHGRSPQ
jgi:hypothetical protein